MELQGRKGPTLIAIAAVIILGVILLRSGGDTNRPVVRSSSPTGLASVNMTEAGFVPASLTIAKGTVVSFTNKDDNPIQIVPNPSSDTASGLGDLVSDRLYEDSIFRYRFDQPGSYAYHDALHPTANGLIIVR